jgi:S-adenosylmethionine synthetase
LYNIIIEELKQSPVEQRRIELVERKGMGHPDSICDAVMEQISVALCREYVASFGRVLHHNIDKGLLVGGRTEPRLGGGAVLEPMRLVIGDRATAQYRGKRIDVGSIAEQTAKDWFRRHLRFVDPERHLVLQNELKEGSLELSDLFEREIMSANDTSAAVGYAPLTETERIVLAAERYLNSPELKRAFPEAGEDVKVMGFRNDRDLSLTVALAFVDRFLPDAAAYFSRKGEIQAALEARLARELSQLDRISVAVNTLDDPQRGESGMYLTVLGISAEAGDSGQVGRGNRVNGVIALNRPMSMEATAGKNPVSHVGKIYSLLTHHIAGQIYASVSGLSEVYVWMCSQIGKPIDQPLMTSVQVVLQQGVRLTDVERDVKEIVRRELSCIGDFTGRLTRGELPVC